MVWSRTCHPTRAQVRSYPAFVYGAGCSADAHSVHAPVECDRPDSWSGAAVVGRDLQSQSRNLRSRQTRLLGPRHGLGPPGLRRLSGRTHVWEMGRTGVGDGSSSLLTCKRTECAAGGRGAGAKSAESSEGRLASGLGMCHNIALASVSKRPGMSDLGCTLVCFLACVSRHVPVLRFPLFGCLGVTLVIGQVELFLFERRRRGCLTPVYQRCGWRLVPDRCGVLNVVLDLLKRR